LIEALQKFHHYYGDDFKVECPTRSGKCITLREVAAELTRRIGRLFLKGEDGQRPVLKYHAKMRLIRISRITSCFTNIFTETAARRWRIASDGVDRLIAKLLRPPTESAETPKRNS